MDMMSVALMVVMKADLLVDLWADLMELQLMGL
jgi:hypothetical protein